jgi:BlaI family penicillinase repressor
MNNILIIAKSILLKEWGSKSVKEKRISASERVFMEMLWEHPEGLRFQDFIISLESRKWDTSTMATFLRRLEDKGYVKHIQQKGKNIYFATLTRERYQKEELMKQARKSIRFSLDELYSAFCNIKVMKQEEINEIEDYLGKLQDKLREESND